MASNQVTPSKEAPLSFMKKINSAVSYFESTTPQPASSSDPALIVVFGWFAARDLHLSKYVAQHRALFPSSSILVIRSTMNHVLWPGGLRNDLLGAAPVLRAVSDADAATGHATGTTPPKVLVHVFSNGGAACAVKMYEVLRAQKSGAVPRHVTIFDSCPGYFHWQRAHRAVTAPLSRWASPLFHVVLLGFWVVHRLLGMKLSPDYNADELNAKALLGVTPKRAYLYGNKDVMVGWEDVEKHAAEAKQLGFDVTTELFEGGKHVSHVRVDGDRYWRVVKETWESR